MVGHIGPVRFDGGEHPCEGPQGQHTQGDPDENGVEHPNVQHHPGPRPNHGGRHFHHDSVDPKPKHPGQGNGHRFSQNDQENAALTCPKARKMAISRRRSLMVL